MSAWDHPTGPHTTGASQTRKANAEPFTTAASEMSRHNPAPQADPPHAPTPRSTRSGLTKLLINERVTQILNGEPLFQIVCTSKTNKTKTSWPILRDVTKAQLDSFLFPFFFFLIQASLGKDIQSSGRSALHTQSLGKKETEPYNSRGRPEDTPQALPSAGWAGRGHCTCWVAPAAPGPPLLPSSSSSKLVTFLLPSMV